MWKVVLLFAFFLYSFRMASGQERKRQIFNQSTLEKAPRPEGRLLCFDLGSKTIGMAVSDEMNSFALPLGTIQRRKLSADLLKIRDVSKEYEVSGYVFGWPLHTDGSVSPGCDRVMSFIDEMYQAPDLFGEAPWILLWDERFSTAAVEEIVDKSVDMKKRKQKGHIDALAAQLILKGALSALQRHSA